MQDLGTPSTAQGVTAAVVFRSQLRAAAPQTGLVSTFWGLAAVLALGSNGSSCVVWVFCEQLNCNSCQSDCSYNERQLQEIQYLMTGITFSRGWLRFLFHTLMQISLNLRSTEGRREQFIWDEPQKRDKSFRCNSLCCCWFVATDFRYEKAFIKKKLVFFFFLDTESMTLTRNYANTQGQPDRARWCFYQQLLVRVRQITGKDHSSSLHPFLLPTFPSCSDKRLTFLHLSAAIKK